MHCNSVGAWIERIALLQFPVLATVLPVRLALVFNHASHFISIPTPLMIVIEKRVE
jgi:hypothetical protein